MGFVLAADVRATVVMICLEVVDHCDVECAENRVGSLHHRTSTARLDLIKSFFDFFGKDSLESVKNGVTWIEEGGDQTECRSNNNLVGSGGGSDPAKRKCLFCETNEVCPSDVK